ncbi:MAG: toprim domain-containing protein, partial [Proteobacteria bacterium]|nr:toprim domain-containing protein [Pseudomonadota bacterium]
YMDVIALYGAGIRCAVAPLGTALTEEQVALLWRLVPEPVLCFDGDEAGRRAMARAAERALPLLKPGFGLRFAELPADEDPDSLIQGGGPEAMERVIEGARPLSEALWRMELGGRPVATPEARASMEERLKRHARRIEDPTVRAHFLSAFKDRLWKRFRRSAAGPAPSAVIEAESGPRTVVGAANRREQVMLAVVLKHPEIFDDVGEALGAMELSGADNERLRQGMIDILNDSPGLDSAALESGLADGGFAQEVTRVLALSEVKSMLRKGGPLSPSASRDDVSGVWEDFVRFNSEIHLDRDIDATLGALKEEITEESWERARALLQSKGEYPEPR